MIPRVHTCVSFQVRRPEAGGLGQGAQGECLARKESPITESERRDPRGTRSRRPTPTPNPFRPQERWSSLLYPSKPGAHLAAGGRRSTWSRAWQEWFMVTVISSMPPPPAADPHGRPSTEPQDTEAPLKLWAGGRHPPVPRSP